MRSEVAELYTLAMTSMGSITNGSLVSAAAFEFEDRIAYPD